MTAVMFANILENPKISDQSANEKGKMEKISNKTKTDGIFSEPPFFINQRPGKGLPPSSESALPSAAAGTQGPGQRKHRPAPDKKTGAMPENNRTFVLPAQAGYGPGARSTKNDTP